MQRITFAVSPDVGIGERLPTIDHGAVLSSALGGPIEALWTPSAGLISCSEDHALLSAVHAAFFGHYPLLLSPDVIWLTLARGFALHVNQNAEALRHRFVRHSGQEKLVVERRDFLPGRANPWPEVFEAFSDQIAERVGKLREFVRCDFSTTGATERAASELMVMDTFKAYFEYEMLAGCGIPSITLTGTVADWKSIRNRAALFAEFGLEAWCKALDPVLAQFVAAAEGRAEPGFWRSLFRYHSGSGPSVMTGWITVLFPYLKDNAEALYPNPYLEDWERRLEIDDRQHWRERGNNPQGVGLWAVPPCLTSVPLKVIWGTEARAMRLVGGLMGVSQSSGGLALQPECGWAVVYDDGPKPSMDERRRANAIPLDFPPITGGT
jgi:hypothetical protein